MSFENQTILITGGLGGIGGEVGRLLLGKGARVVISDRASAEAGKSKLGADADYVNLDVTSEDGWQRTIDGIVKRHGAINGLVNIAGVFTPGIAFQDMTLAQWRYHMDVCLLYTSMMGTLLRHGSGAQKRSWLPQIARGEIRLQAFGVTEPSSGSDTLALRTTAVPDGDHYIICLLYTSRCV